LLEIFFFFFFNNSHWIQPTQQCWNWQNWYFYSHSASVRKCTHGRAC